MLLRRLFQFRQLGVGGVFGLPAERALHMLDDGIEGTVGVIRRAAKRDAREARLAHVIPQALDQRRFANAGFTTEQHDLAQAVLALFPAAQQQARFLRHGPPGRRIHR